MEAPKTLQQAVVYFSKPENCNAFMIAARWPDAQVRCPQCGSENITYLENARLYKCYSKHPRQKFSLKVGTIFEDSALGLDKWLVGIWLIANAKNGISSCELARGVGVTQKSAWHMLHRIRLAMQKGTLNKLSGHVEVDETYIGGKARNMHRAVLANRVSQFATPRTGRNQNIGKVAVMGLLERNGEIRTMVVGGTKRHHLHSEVTKNVEAGSFVYTDALRSYNELGQQYIHSVINHAEKYVDGLIHTNGVENFWSLLKRTIKGTYVSVEPFHLFRYLDEQTFRFNTRKGTDFQRFFEVLSTVTGKRLEYKKLTAQPSC
jgi:transposase-like protein